MKRDFTIRRMKPDEAATVCAMVRAIAVHVGSAAVPAVTAEALRAAEGLIDTLVAAGPDGTLRGCCLTLLTFSTWRGCAGIYVVDLFVDPELRGQGVGRALLQRAAREAHARGARFIKLEVDATNETALHFYRDLGFGVSNGDRLLVLERDGFERMSTNSEP